MFSLHKVTGCLILIGALWVMGWPLKVQAQALTPPPVPPFGVHIDPNVTPSDLEALQSLGVGWVRFAVSWAQVEPIPGQGYRWEQYDRPLKALSSAGLRPILIITDVPEWAAQPLPQDDTRKGCGPVRPEAETAFRDFIQALVERYGAPPYNVTYWEIANEPDYIPAAARPLSELNEISLGGCFGLVWRSAYVRHLETAYRAIKAVQPTSTVVIGGLAYDYFYWPERGERGVFDPLFLDVVVGEERALDVADALGLHAYSEWAERWAPWGPDIQGKINYVRAQLDAWGYQDKPIVLTEVGRPSRSPNGPGDYTPQKQAAYVPKVFARVLAVIPKEPLIWYNLRDLPNETAAFGLLTADGTPKPAFTAYRFAVRQFSGAQHLTSIRQPPPNWEWPLDRVEAYLYTNDQGPFLVLWATGQEEVTVRIPGDTLQLWDLFGEPVLITDGSDGDIDRRVDGMISLGVDASPVYLRGEGIGSLQAQQSLAAVPPTPTPWPTLTPTPPTFWERVTIYRPSPLNTLWVPLGLLILSGLLGILTVITMAHAGAPFERRDNE